MIKILLIGFGFFMSTLAFAESCGTTSCFDYCTSSYQTLSGNTCESTFNYSKSCYQASAFCKNESGRNPCAGKTISCFDYCTTSYVTVNGNKCETEFNFSKSCYQAVGRCSN